MDELEQIRKNFESQILIILKKYGIENNLLAVELNIICVDSLIQFNEFAEKIFNEKYNLEKLKNGN